MTNRWISVFLLCTAALSVPAMAENAGNALNAAVSVSGQMSALKFNALLKNGFKSVIVNRPDEEQGNNISVSELRDIAEKSQVSVIYQPVSSNNISQRDIIEFAKYYHELPKPILMICKSGSRSSALFNQAKAQGLLNE